MSSLDFSCHAVYLLDKYVNIVCSCFSEILQSALTLRKHHYSDAVLSLQEGKQFSLFENKRNLSALAFLGVTGVLLPELVLGLVLLHVHVVPTSLCLVKSIAKFNELLPLLDKFNCFAGDYRTLDQEELAWPGIDLGMVCVQWLDRGQYMCYLDTLMLVGSFGKLVDVSYVTKEQLEEVNASCQRWAVFGDKVVDIHKMAATVR